ncbi:MAG: PilZ domain-containing protein, partial [Deltaproteobacteria bacterium]|nr:PilZ domain-containing protein [Deltaproteobacteria bacterium]
MSDEARKEQKVKAKALKVKYKSATLEDFIEQYAKDISRTGMWIKTPKPPALGELLKIEIQLKDETPVLKAAGRVVQRREEAEARPDAPPGMGVRFLKVDEGQEVLERIMARKGEGAGPHFESLRPSPASVAPPANIDARSGDFFGNGPQPPLPAEQDQTVMRQMNALLGEALRIAKSPSQAPGEGAGESAKAVGSMKSTMVGMGLAEAAEAVKAARSALAQAEAAKPAATPARESPAPRAAAQMHVGSTPAPATTSNLRATMEFTSGAQDVVKAPSEPPGTVPMKPADVAAVSDDSTQRASRVELDAALRAMRELPDDPRAAAAVVAVAKEAQEEPPVAAVVAEAKEAKEEEEAPVAAVVVAEAKEETPVAAVVAEAKEEEAPAAATVSTPEAAPIDDDARVTAVPEKKPEAKSIERLIEEAVEEAPASVRPAAPASVRPAATVAAAAAARALDVDAAPKKRSPVMLYAAIGVVLAIGVVAMLMQGGGDTPAEPTPAPIAEPTPGGDPGPAAPTPPIPPREPPTPPTIEQPPTPPPVPTVQPQPQTTAEPDPPRPTPTEPAPEPAVVPLPSTAPEPA